MTRLHLTITLFCLAGCATGTQYFAPGASVRGVRADGNRQAQYVLQGAQGRFGEAEVWTRGSVVAVLDGAQHTVLHVGFEFNNTGALPLVFAAEDVSLEIVHTDAGSLKEIKPHMARALSVPPQTRAQTQAIFVLPDGVAPSEIHGFRVRWAAHEGAQVYRQATPFLELPDAPHTNPYGYGGYGYYGYGYPYYGYFPHYGYGPCYGGPCTQVIVVPRGPAMRRTSARP